MPQKKTTAAADEAGADSGQLVGKVCGESFTVGTKVLLASGAASPISLLRVGDKVLATDTKTGTPQPEAVTAVLVHHDTDLLAELADPLAGGHGSLALLVLVGVPSPLAGARAYPGVMTLTVHLPGELAAALEAEAARRGQTPDQTAADLLAERLPLPGTRRRLAFAAVGSSLSGRSAADADEMLAEGFGRGS